MEGDEIMMKKALSEGRAKITREAMEALGEERLPDADELSQIAKMKKAKEEEEKRGNSKAA